MEILNLTQHAATPEQLAAGVVDLTGPLRAELVNLITFDELPPSAEVKTRAEALATLAWSLDFKAAMIGGAPFLMGALERALLADGIKPAYAFSVRDSVDAVQPDGSVKKVAVFRHQGFVEVTA